MKTPFIISALLSGLATATALGACPGEGSCFLANGTPGCDDVSCCTAICAVDPFCCDNNWDSLCALEAEATCAPACPSPCLGDLNADLLVSGADLGILLGNWSGAGCGDLNEDGIIDGADLGIMLGQWGACPLFCGNPNAGDCCSPNGTPFCDDASCCELICADDPFCCNTAWDSACANAAAAACAVCVPPECAHDLCVTGVALDPACDPCVASICAVDAFCCSSSWDSVCVGEVASVCGLADCIGAACAHSPCVTGVALDAGCDPCVGSICAVDPFCCSNSWDAACVNEVATVCGLTCPVICAHSVCLTGVALDPECDPCVESICAVDPFCCSNNWDSVCVGQVASVCGLADCIGAACAHSPCVTGVALDAGCDACVGAICAVDPFCCSNSWDSACVNEVDTVCGLTCP